MNKRGILSLTIVVVSVAIFFGLWVFINADSCLDAGGRYLYSELRCEIDVPYIPLSQRPQKWYLLAESAIVALALSSVAVLLAQRLFKKVV